MVNTTKIFVKNAKGGEGRWLSADQLRVNGMSIEDIMRKLEMFEQSFTIIIEELTKQNETLRDRFATGGVAYTKDGDYVKQAIVIPPDSKFTALQELPEEMKTRLYQSFPFLKEGNEKLIEDRKQKSKYEGAKL